MAQPSAQLGPSAPAQAIAATPAQTDALNAGWRAILAANAVAVVGMDEYGKKCSQPPFPCAKRAKQQTEISLRKWGRFALVEDPREADLVMVAMETLYAEGQEVLSWAQLRVFKGPATPAFLAEVQKKLGAQLFVYTGPVPMEKQVELLWEGWRSSEQPQVQNPKARLIPSPTKRLAIALLDAVGKKMSEKEFERRVKENPYDPQVIGEVAQSWGDAITAIKELTGQLSKERHMMVADDFSRAVAEAEKSLSRVTPSQPQQPGSAVPTAERQVAHALPGGRVMWLEVATMLAAGRPAEDATAMVKERGIAFDADREALWSLEALGAPEGLLPAVRTARVEDYYEPDPATWVGFCADAEHTFREGLQTQPNNPVLHYGLARSLDGQEKTDATIAEYREVLRLKPDFETARLNLGVALGRSGDLKGAIKELREVIRLNPGNALAHDNLGVALDAKGDLEGSVAEHLEAVRLKPDFVGAHLNLGAALAARRDLDGAVAEYREALRRAPRYARAHYALGTALGKKGDLPGARLELQEALRLNPNHALTRYVLGNVLRLEGDLDGALAEYRQALRLQPDFPEAESNLTAVFQLAGKPGAAEKESRKAVRKNPADPFAHNALGAALLRKGDLKGAIQELREAVRLKADYSEAHANLGAALIQKGEVDEGAAELREAVRLKPHLADTHFLLGQTLERKGDKAGAREAFRQAHTLAPQNAEYKAKYEELSRQE